MPDSIPALATTSSQLEWKAASSGNRILLYLGASSLLPATGVLASDLDFRFAQGGVPPLTPAVVPGGTTWQEISPADMPGWYSLELNPAWIAQPGPWLAKLRPVSGSPTPFAAVALTGRVVGLVLTDVQADLSRALGLLQENYVMRNHVYDPRGNLLSAEVALFASAADVSNPLAVPTARYSMTATYDLQGRLLRYAVIKL